jgi:uncharacterized membrane protein YgdD (TMEM256/DUF423 family)
MTDHTLQKQMIQTGAALSGISVALGALGAHLLKDLIDEQAMDTFQTALRYQFYHAFAIVMVGAMLRKLNPKYSRMIFQFFIYGIIVFCGSLYVLALRKVLFGDYADSVIFIGGLTPIGGVLFILGWGVLAYKGYKFSDGTGSSEHSHRHRSSSSKAREEEYQKAI